MFPADLKNSFDIVVCAGLINSNHMDERLFEEMILGLDLVGDLH